MNLQEFIILMKNAYKFLGVNVDADAATSIFNMTDQDKDGWITYQEYFSFMHTHILKIKLTPLVEKKPLPKVRNSRLRKFIWEAIRRLLAEYMTDSQLVSKDLEKVIREILKN